MKVRRKRRPGPPGARWLASIARAQGIAAKPRPKHDGTIGVCPEHLTDELLLAIGFVDRVTFVAYVEHLSRRGGNVRASVTLPRAKRPPGIVRLQARRCPGCRGRVGIYCGRCDGIGWGLYMEKRRPRQTAAKAAA